MDAVARSQAILFTVHGEGQSSLDDVGELLALVTVRLLTCGNGWDTLTFRSETKRSARSVSSAFATLFRDVSASDERPLSTIDRKLVDSPASRLNSLSDKPFSLRSDRIALPTATISSSIW
jgi:hypothetical protein